MKKLIWSLAMAAVVISADAKAPKDEVLMTVNGKPVTVSEFQYLYNKNNSQQLNQQSIDEYLDMFVTYKQKVAEAEAEGLDKSQEFLTEYNGYRRELAEPYMIDKAVEDSLINVVYQRMKDDVDVSHIMVANNGRGIQPSKQYELLDSIRTAILNGADFGALARKYSIDRSAKRNNGHMGFMNVNRFPYTFEEAAYDTPVGEISPIIETPYGYHIVKVEGRRPARGQVLVEHILKLTQGVSEKEAAHKKEQIDSISVLLANGGNFEEIAKAESEDPGSKAAGGKLQWFGIGMMVPEFEDAAFALKKGETSAPIKTSYGYHIIHKLDERGVEDFDAAKTQIKGAIQSDERVYIPRKRKIDQLRHKFGLKVNDDKINAIKAQIIENGGLDSALIEELKANKEILAQMGKRKFVAAYALEDIMLNPNAEPQIQAQSFVKALNNNIDEAALEDERKDLTETNADYRNLLNEYRDGILLFNVSDKNVWSKAKDDQEGLNKYFESHRDRYTWASPKLKSFVIFATSDSIISQVQEYLNENPDIPNDKLSETLRVKFGKEVKVEKVIAAKGENAITDYIAFGGDKPDTKSKWTSFIAYRNKVVAAPEEPADVRGAVTSDYQNELETEWVKTLKQKYPVKVNKKVLKKIK